MDGESQIPTIGYGARSIGEFVETLEVAGTEYLVDVRSAPYSRFKPEFSRDPLAARLEGRGMAGDRVCVGGIEVDTGRILRSSAAMAGICTRTTRSGQAWSGISPTGIGPTSNRPTSRT
jgi:Domain of unknown function DUF488